MACGEIRLIEKRGGLLALIGLGASVVVMGTTLKWSGPGLMLGFLITYLIFVAGFKIINFRETVMQTRQCM